MHGSRYGCAGDKVCPIFGEKNALTDCIDRMAGTANALHAACDGGWSFDLNDKVDGTHVDAEFESGRGTESFDLTGPELLFDDGSLIGGERTVVGASDLFAGKVVECTGQSLGNLTAIDEQDGRLALTDEFKQAGMNRIPD